MLPYISCASGAHLQSQCLLGCADEVKQTCLHLEGAAALLSQEGSFLMECSILSLCLPSGILQTVYFTFKKSV